MSKKNIQSKLDVVLHEIASLAEKAEKKVDNASAVEDILEELSEHKLYVNNVFVDVFENLFKIQKELSNFSEDVHEDKRIEEIKEILEQKIDNSVVDIVKQIDFIKDKTLDSDILNTTLNNLSKDITLSIKKDSESCFKNVKDNVKIALDNIKLLEEKVLKEIEDRKKLDKLVGNIAMLPSNGVNMLAQLLDVDLSGVTVVNGKYVLGSGGGSSPSSAPTALTTTGTINNQAIPTSWLIYTGTSSVTLTGLVAPTVDGTEVVVTNNNATGRPFAISHQSASSTAANRIICPGNGTVSLRGGFSTKLRYSMASARWHVVQQVLTANTPMIVNGNVLDILTAGFSQNGILTAADWQLFYGKMGFNTGNSSLGVGAVPFADTNTYPSSWAADNTKFNYDRVSENLGVGLPKNELQATIHASGAMAAAIPDVADATVSYVLEVPAGAAFTGFGTQIQPYCQRAGSFTATAVAGVGYVMGDVIDYRIYTQDNTGKYSVVFAEATVTITALTASVDLAWALPAFMSNTVDYFRIIKQVNSGGFIEGTDVAGTAIAYNDTNFTSTDITVTPLSPDFVANGSTRNYNAYGTAEAPVSLTLYSSASAPYPLSFSDDNSGDAYLIEWHVEWSAPSTALFIENGTGGYFSGGIGTDVTFLETPTSFPFSTTPPPEHYGILANGSNLNVNWAVWGCVDVGGINHFSNAPYTLSTSDPNDSAYYSIDINYSASSSGVRIIADIVGASVGSVTVFGASNYYAAAFNFPFSGDTTTAPAGLYRAVGKFEQYTSTVGEDGGIIIKGIGDYASFEFQNSAGVRIGFIECSNDGTINFVCNNLLFNGNPV